MSNLKVIAIAKPPKYFYRIGENFAYSKWYNSEKVKDIPVAIGDSVEIVHEKIGTESVLTSLKNLGQTQQSSSEVGSKPQSLETPPKGYSGVTNGTNWDKVNDGIRKQAVGKMVARTLQAMELKDYGSTDVIVVMKELFKAYDELTK